MQNKVKDMTSGTPAKLIMLFAIPLMLGSVFQQLYILTDTAIVGQVAGVEALAALGAADWTNWMILGIISGFSQGFSIIIAQLYGAKSWKRLKQAVGTSYCLMVIIAILVTGISLLSVEYILNFLNTPAHIIHMSVQYLSICFMATPIIAAYNMFASLLRAVGNSRSPLVAMIIASFVNIGLDIWFVAGLHGGVVGAAIATVIAQAVSALYCYRIVRKIDVLKIEKEDFKINREDAPKLLKVAAPVAIQNTIISVGGMAVQSVVNGFGVLLVAGFTATNKLYGILELASISYGYAMTTYVGQNLGAHRVDRIKKGVRQGALMAVLTSGLISLLMFTAGRMILSMFVSGNPAEVEQVLDIAYHYLFIMSCNLWILYLLFVYRASLQGLGDTVIPLVSGIIEMIMRVGVSMFLPLFVGQEGIYYAEVSAWTGAAVLLMVSYFIRARKLE